MKEDPEKIKELLEKLDVLLKRQESFSEEINGLREEIYQLKTGQSEVSTEVEPVSEFAEEDLVPSEGHSSKEKIKYYVEKEPAQKHEKPPASKPKIDLEKFIGENLISKIGIVITIIGVAIGAKYTIENQLISPLTRIVLGYLVGIGLLGFGIRLKEKYKNYSAVLVSGAMAIMYFITFAAYSFYDLFPQVIAFALMVVFTIFTVIAAINYNKQVIALIGLVGAYAVPFLLGDGSGNVVVLFSYMVIINIGVLAIAFQKYWKPVYYSAFVLTWVIYSSWSAFNFYNAEYFNTGFAFLILFFVTFYVTFLAYKLLRKEQFNIGDILLLLANSFIFYGHGYAYLYDHASYNNLLGLFTLVNAIIHFIVSLVIYQQKLGDRKLFYLVSGLVLVFITIAIPVQLDGNWVTLLWAGQAVLLFWIGRTKAMPFYEQLSYPLMVLAFFSIIHDWNTAYHIYIPDEPETRISPLFNVNFLMSLLFIAGFFFINKWNRSEKYAAALPPKNWIFKIMSVLIPGILLVTLFFTFKMEISTYWTQLSIDSALTVQPEGQTYPNYYKNLDFDRFRTIWEINYALFFFSLLAFVNFKYIGSRLLAFVNLGLAIVTFLIFFSAGLSALTELRDSYLEQKLSEYYQRGIFNLIIRYISLAFATLLLFASYRFIRQKFLKSDFQNTYDFLFHIAIIWMISSELMNWMEIAGSAQSDKLAISIFWGIYALFLIILGIWKKQKHLRMGAIALFAVTLIKLFFYDLSDLDTIAKTTVFVSLGVLLLVISFLYNKYNHLINEVEAEN